MLDALDWLSSPLLPRWLFLFAAFSGMAVGFVLGVEAAIPLDRHWRKRR